MGARRIFSTGDLAIKGSGTELPASASRGEPWWESGGESPTFWKYAYNTSSYTETFDNIDFLCTRTFNIFRWGKCPLCQQLWASLKRASQIDALGKMFFPMLSPSMCMCVGTVGCGVEAVFFKCFSCNSNDQPNTCGETFVNSSSNRISERCLCCRVSITV